MPFIGNTPDVNFTSFAKQDLTGVTGSPAKRGFTLTHAVANANEIEVFVNNVRQEPTEAYTVNGTGLTMTGDVETSDDFYIIYLGKAIQTTVPPDGSVSTAKIADSAVTASKVDNTLHLSTIKDSTGSNTGINISSNGIITKPLQPAFYARPTPYQNNIATEQWVDVPFTNIIANQGNHFGGNVFTAPITGFYHFSTFVRLDQVDTSASYYMLGWLIGGTTLQAELIDPNFTADLNYMGLNSSLTYYMTATQTAQVRIYQHQGTSQTDVIADSWFSGHLIG